MTDDYQPSQDFIAARRYWWLIVLFMLAGLAAAWGFASLNPPWYEARAEIAVNFDLHRTGTLTGENQDILVNTVGKIISSAPIMDALMSDARSMGFDGDAANFLRIAVAERKAESFVLRVQHPDSRFSLQMAERWTDYALAALDRAEKAAIEADLLHRYLDGLAGCLQGLASSTTGDSTCPVTTLEDLQAQISRTQQALLETRAEARGLTSGVRHTLVQPAALLERPVQYQSSRLLLAGTGIGFILALLVIHFQIPRWLLREGRRA